MDIEDAYSHSYRTRVKKRQKNMVGDSVVVKRKKLSQELPRIQSIKNNRRQNVHTALFRGERTAFFVTQDSRKYISQLQQYKKMQGYVYIDTRGRFDSVHVRYVQRYPARVVQQQRIVAEFRDSQNIIISFRRALALDLSPFRMWQVSLAGAVLFGMISMSMIYRNFGQNVFAKDGGAEGGTTEDVAALVVDDTQKEEVHIKEKSQKKEKAQEEKHEKKKEKEENDAKTQKKNKKEEKIKEQSHDDATEESIKEQEAASPKNITQNKEEKHTDKKPVDSVVKKEERAKEKKEDDDEKGTQKSYSLEESAYEMVKGYPIEKMLPYILEQDPEVAKYMIAIAKQESQWGKRVPVLNGQDCYNYWGYRAQRKLMGSGGHTCFNSRKDAVETVGKRIHELIYKYNRKNARNLVVWKCGNSCAGHSQASVNRWIGVVDSYHDKLSQ